MPSPLSIFYYAIRGFLYLIFSAFGICGFRENWFLALPRMFLSFMNRFEGYSYLSLERCHRYSVQQIEREQKALDFLREQRDHLIEARDRERRESKWLREKIEGIIRRFEITERFRTRSRANTHTV
ncbi:hypothetical protein ANCCAN_03815 [Ancylostoma caninum]|uniref:Uncharacterized protein n=1 Tax=Ancylostoma caninum TaxID=29170 RepID=A0A368H410_ANCCA|nr:hypothetical protein ANCCAN_03815 [Ancylostoma caninum]